MALADTAIPTRPTLLGADVEVPLVTGGWRRYVNLDYAASAPPFLEVSQAVANFLPYYSSVHRGAGYKSRVSTAAYEAARDALHRFFSARAQDVVIFTRNTTDSINLLASALPPRASVVTFASEHHANLLPWRRDAVGVTYLPPPRSAREAVEALGAHLALGARTDLVSVTGASNVTGELWPVREITRLAHRHGARVLLDAAQLAPHSPISMEDLEVDYMAASGHKLYAPFGAGVLIGRSDWLRQMEPFLRGGGAVDFVTTSDVLWSELPERQEAGSPNVVGAVALAEATRVLERYGMGRLGAEELSLATHAWSALRTVPDIELYGLWDADAPRIGVSLFNLRGYDHSQLATILSAEYAIGVRHGCFCAHPLMLELLHVDRSAAASIRARMKAGDKLQVPGAVRLSIGLGTTKADIDYLVDALKAISAEGPRWKYGVDPQTGEYAPMPDPRPWPPSELIRTDGAQ